MGGSSVYPHTTVLYSYKLLTIYSYRQDHIAQQDAGADLEQIYISRRFTITV